MTQIIQGIHLPDGDTHFRKHLDANPLVDGKGTYQFSKLQMALALGTRRRHAVDIGAHVGLWSRVLAREFANVTAFEPVPAHVECLRLNLRGISNVALHTVALGDLARKAKIAPGLDNSGTSHVTDAGDVEAQMMPLDDFGLTDVDFIKIDVEGFEYQVVLGGEQTIRTYEPFMIVEQKGAGRAAVDLLVTWGASIKWKKSGDYGLGWGNA